MSHQEHLLEAFKLAQIRQGFCAPNPSVGAVIVKEGVIISRGYHMGAGCEHAEVMAIRNTDADLSDASLYVTLEPCCHWGRTPPCTDLILERKIKAVYYGYKDPNELVSGKGIANLLANGVSIHHIQFHEINQFYESYTYWTHTKRPWIISKLAITLDSKIAGQHGSPVKITGAECQNFTHQQRLRADAILTSVKTILSDDPDLNVRLNEQSVAKTIFVLDLNLQIPLSSKIIANGSQVTVLHAANDLVKIKMLEEKGVHCVRTPQHGGRLILSEVMSFIGSVGIHELWVEAGGTLFTALLERKLVNKSYIYIAPILLGKSAQTAFDCENNLLSVASHISWFNLGKDIVCSINW